MPPLPQFIDVPRQRKRRRLEMPNVADARPRRPLSALKHVLPPPARQLHPPRPPPLLIQVTPDLKTISTTSIGLLSSSSGGEDLAAFLLPHRDQSTPTPRGIDLSPGKRGKFIRGGLAARASTLFNSAHISLVLWQKDTERRATNLPHLTATLVRILHLHAKPSLVVALCRIHHHTDSSYSPNQLYKIIFSVLSLGQIKEGLTFRIFHPWHELSSASSSPAPLPLPLSLPSTPDLPINSTTTLFCSRFIF